MNSIRALRASPLLLIAFLPGCKQTLQQTLPTKVQPRVSTGATAPGSTPTTPAVSAVSSPAQVSSAPGLASPAVVQSPASADPQKLEDVQERKGPFAFGGQAFSVVTHTKRLSGKPGEFQQALALLEIVDAAGNVQYREEFPHEIQNGEFSEACSVGITPITGSNGAGLLLDEGCLPSAPLSGGPWRVLGVVNGKLASLGEPLYAEGEMGDFIPGKINHIGSLTQILPDELRVRLFTGYFFVSVPIRVNWLQGRLELAQHCFYQTGHGAAEGGCEMPVDGAERHPSEQEMTFVRMFAESNEQIGAPAHVVIKRDSKVQILLGKLFVRLDEGKDSVGLEVGGDIWLKVRIDGKEGWIHTDEDLRAIGLYQSG